MHETMKGQVGRPTIPRGKSAVTFCADFSIYKLQEKKCCLIKIRDQRKSAFTFNVCKVSIGTVPFPFKHNPLLFKAQLTLNLTITIFKGMIRIIDRLNGWTEHLRCG